MVVRGLWAGGCLSYGCWGFRDGGGLGKWGSNYITGGGPCSLIHEGNGSRKVYNDVPPTASLLFGNHHY